EEERGGFDRVFDVEVGKQLVLAHEDHAAQHVRVFHGIRAEDCHGAGCGEFLCGDQPHQCALARTVAAEQSGDAACFDIDTDVVECCAVSVLPCQVECGDHWCHECFPSSGWVDPRTSEISVSRSMPSRSASASIGSMYCSAKRFRRSASSRSRAPVATNMPIPLRFSSRPSSISALIPLAAVAGLIRWNAANSLVDGTRSPSARLPSAISSATCPASCTNSGVPSSSTATSTTRYVGSLVN